ncbi:BLUF domain-containing protein [Aquamicrobium zhengzhouense]|uniref:BLUF domain-containing protein n=1 Tax=Aquamicrobium zhengzhouense TaxID=2781738 RepID=A0ABS0SEY3_9HYPH|nr:BLUF domain-containing protein [Aquamicrobium zhengzhouense]MBI1621281.1 BLUF domain-containing protein [Aquamicrobium zhengzhouense]
MHDNLIRLSYVSTLRTVLPAAEIDAMVADAARFNKANTITGLLAIDGQRICQILEGPAEAVGSLYASIEKDERHYGVAKIVHQPIAKTSFEDWGMVRRDMVDIAIYALSS